MSHRRRFLLGAGSLGVMASLQWLCGCAPKRPLVVAIAPWIGYETLYLAREFGWLPPRVTLLDGRNASDSLAALKTGKADAACLTLDEMLRARGDGVPLTAVLVFDVSAGADVVLARPSIKHLGELANKRLGVEEGALGALVLAKLMEAAGVPESALKLVDLPPDRQLEAWRRNEVDAVITYEPTATLLTREGAQRLFDSRQMPDTIFDVLAVRAERTREADGVRELASSHFRALEHMRTNREDAIYRISAREGISADDARQVMAGVVLPSLAANRGYLAGSDSRLARAARELSSVMKQHGLLVREDPLDDLITPAGLPPDEQ